MTTVKIYGKLAKKFGSQIKLHLGRTNDFIHAIDCIKNDFRKELISLSEKGMNYSFEKRGNEIYLLPSICGAGRVAMIVISIVAIIAIVAIAFALAAMITAASATAGVGATAATTAFGVLTGAAVLTSGIGVALGAATIATALVFGAAVSVLSSAVFMKTPSTPGAQQQTASVGGATSNAADATKSYIFNNQLNSATQGSLIPIGYGRHRISSKLINVSIRNYSTNLSFENEARENITAEINFYD